MNYSALKIEQERERDNIYQILQDYQRKCFNVTDSQFIIKDVKQVSSNKTADQKY